MIDCYVLNNGARVLSTRSAVKTLTGNDSGGLAEYLGAKAIKPFISKGLDLAETVDFTIPGTQFEGRGLTAEQFMAGFGDMAKSIGVKGLKSFLNKDLTMAETIDFAIPDAPNGRGITAEQFMTGQDAGNLVQYLGRKGLNGFIANDLDLVDFSIPGTQFEGRGLTAEQFMAGFGDIRSGRGTPAGAVVGAAAVPARKSNTFPDFRSSKNAEMAPSANAASRDSRRGGTIALAETP